MAALSEPFDFAPSRSQLATVLDQVKDKPFGRRFAPSLTWVCAPCLRDELRRAIKECSPAM